MTPLHPQSARQPDPLRLPEALAALSRACALLGTHGTGLIIAALAKGPADLPLVRERVPGISDGVLTRRLRELTALGLVARTVQPDTPTRARYTLASRGKALIIPLVALTVWAEEHLPANAPERPRREGRVHEGT
ncbi:helix-turn-helix domain-containing protein [Streptomyces sp. NPDC013178]|uniref:winged helix-turn-helix transcriptional regulator n=1 Tax=unclassified Streptomyces TaxID=2593676 RepID=UPI0033EDCDD9